MEGLTALVVDDSKSARFAMRRFLEGCGCQVETLPGGEEALAALRAPQARLPDVLFLDHVMPGMDGLEVLDRVRADPATAQLPVVICSSNDSGEFLLQARLKGAIEVLVKPPVAGQLAEVIARLRHPLSGVAAAVAVIAKPLAPAPAALAPPAPAADAPPTVKLSRVQTIRDPEETIEQAVMKSLREALPMVGNPVTAAPARLEPTLPEASSSTASEHRDPPLRGEIEAQLRELTHEFSAQLEGLRSRLAEVEAPTPGREPTGDDPAAGIEERLATRFEARIVDIAGHFDDRLTTLRGELLALIEAQERRVDDIARQAHAAAIDEAHAVSERVVMNASRRISDQIAESILSVLKPHGFSQTA